MTYDDGNVFARILRGELPAHIVHDDAHCLAFMDLMPQAPGHTLIVPRARAIDLLDVEPDALTHTILLTQRIARAVKQAFGTPGVMVVQLNGAAAGQSVFHLHFHVIPRAAGLDMRLHARETAPAATLAEHAARIRGAFNAGNA